MKRYKIECDDFGFDEVEDEDGYFVHAADVAALERELAEARAAESYRGMETLLLQRDKMIAELRGELTAAQSVLEDQREALEAIGCESADAALWAAMKRQRDQAQSDLAQARAELAEWNDPDSSRRQALMEEIILDVGDGQRSEVEPREAQLDATEAALKQARAELEALRKERDLAYARGCRDESAQCAKNMAPVVERLSRLEAVVRRVEWITIRGVTFCPECSSWLAHKHNPNCALAAALGENGEVG